jgi:RNA polymerase sigma factor (sigma-70 family)
MMNTTDSQTLLAEYAKSRSESAFTELVARYIGLVYSTALRLVYGDRHLAEDVAQMVFIELARNAPRLPREVMLGGWLHARTFNTAASMMRAERRRANREKGSVEMNILQDDSNAAFAQMAPILDEAITQLEEKDRTAILLRFFERRDLRSIGQALGTTEDAAQKRVSRALEKLQLLLQHRGITLPAAALAAGLASEALTAAPAGLAASIAAGALTGAVTGGAASSLLSLTILAKLKVGLIGVLLVGGVATPLLLQHRSQVALREDNNSLRERIQQLEGTSEENERLSNLLNAATSPIPADQLHELLRLRNEVGMLRSQTNRLEELRKDNRRLQELLTQRDQDPGKEQVSSATQEFQERGIPKLQDAKLLVLWLMMYQNDNPNRFATNFEQLAYITNGIVAGTEVHFTGTNHFEIMYQGLFSGLAQPAQGIVLRETQPWQSADGSWNRAYGFADGHSEIHKAPDGSFESWEKEHTLSPR